jgi:hypothetical protein
MNRILIVLSLFIFSCVFCDANNGTEPCDSGTTNNNLFQRYFQGMDLIYKNTGPEGTCYPVHKECGWPKRPPSKRPLLVFSLGLEGAGHHLWTELMNKPLFDCVWINGRYYQRDLADGVPRTTLASQYSGFKEAFQLRKDSGQPPCTRIFDAEDSFPTGAIRKSGRVFMRPDIVHLQDLDGIMYDLKFLIIIRNTTVSEICRFQPHLKSLILLSTIFLSGYGDVRVKKKFFHSCCSRTSYGGAYFNLRGSRSAESAVQSNLFSSL